MTTASFFAGDLRTGEVLVSNIPASAGDAAVALNGAGEITCTVKVPMKDPYTGVEIPFANLIEPCRCFLGYEVNGIIINAGPIWSDQWNSDDGTFTVTAAGLRSYWNYRYVIPALNDSSPSDTPQGHDWPGISAVTLGTIAKRLVQQAQAWTGGSVPIVFPADEVGTSVRNAGYYKGVDRKNLNEALNDLTNVINGPDLAFRPSFTDSSHKFVQWNMMWGSPELSQNGADWQWNQLGPAPSIKGLSVTRDGSVYATDNYEIGDPQTSGATDGPVWMSKSYDPTLVNEGFPRMESSDSHSGVVVLQTLQDYSDQAVLTGRYPSFQWAMNVRLDGPPTITDVHEGDWASVQLIYNPFNPGLLKPRFRVLGFKVNHGDNWVPLTIAPERL